MGRGTGCLGTSNLCRNIKECIFISLARNFKESIFISLARTIKESIFIRVNSLTLNRNIGKFNLPHTWDRVLLNRPGLNLKGMHRQLGMLIPTPYQIIPPSPLNTNNANFPSHLLTGSEHVHRTS